jgi:hypothetical protein
MTRAGDDRQITSRDLLSQLMRRGNTDGLVASAMPNRNGKRDLTERNIPAMTQQPGVIENTTGPLSHRLVDAL